MARLIRGFAKDVSSGRGLKFLFQPFAIGRFREPSKRVRGATVGPPAVLPEMLPLADEMRNRQDPGEPDRDTARSLHGVRALKVWEEGFDLECLPNGIFGFTYSPGHVDAPVFRCDAEAAFEIHKLPDGRSFLLCYVSEESAAILDTARKDIHLWVFPSKSTEASRLISVPLGRIVRYKDYPPHDGTYLEVQITPAPEERQAGSHSIGTPANQIRRS